MRVKRLLPLLGLAVLLAGAAPAGAAEEARTMENPHGTLAESCALCHRQDAWKPAIVSDKFDHSKYGMPLKGAHASAACRSCHASLDFKRAGTACVDCHQDVHRGEFGADCQRCHTTRNFIERAEETRRHRLTRFPLTGAHTALDCSECHRPASSGQLTYAGTPLECEGCHLDAFNTAKSPDHVASGFSHDCSQCHSVASWQAGSFNHAASGFPLTGTHRTLSCDACHPGGKFQGTPTDCYTCHATDWSQTMSPAHGAAGFTTDCKTCHSTRAWTPTTFNHGSTGFALTGAHRPLACSACHATVYTGTSPLCVSCHQQNYDATTNPAHSAAGFPTDCASCHSTTSWAGAKFNHDSNFFPIYSGRHNGLWSTCSTCHINSANYADFSCFNCHPHSDPVQTASNHGGVRNYQYNSQACYSCHPRGRAGD